MMRVLTLTAVVGTTACNIRCPYCISKMTPDCGLGREKRPFNRRNFEVACRFARATGVSTVLLTGKGEPTLFPEDVTSLVEISAGFGFPFIELQTNGVLFIGKTAARYAEHLKGWHSGGMTTVSISIAHFDPERNAALVAPNLPKGSYDIWEIVRVLHSIGFSVRVNCTLVRGYIDSAAEVESLLEACRTHEVEQVTIRNVTRPEYSDSPEAAAFVDAHRIEGLEGEISRRFSEAGARELLRLSHGAIIYDWKGQNLCVSNCLTSSSEPENMRQLIFFPDGHLRYDWKYKGAVLL